MLEGTVARDKAGTRIVVGVDGSPSSRYALLWALRQARASGGTVEAVTVRQHGAAPGLSGMSELGSTALRTGLMSFHDVTVRRRILDGPPARVLAREAAGAGLLVVGSYGNGGLTGPALGPVSHYRADHASCPVAVIRSPPQAWLGEVPRRAPAAMACL